MILIFSFSQSLNSIAQLSFLFDSHLTTIVSASGAYGVVDVILAAVRANGQCWSYSSVVCSSLESPGFGLSSFRMCHFYLLFNDLLFTILSVSVLHYFMPNEGALHLNGLQRYCKSSEKPNEWAINCALRAKNMFTTWFFCSHRHNSGRKEADKGKSPSPFILFSRVQRTFETATLPQRLCLLPSCSSSLRKRHPYGDAERDASQRLCKERIYGLRVVALSGKRRADVVAEASCRCGEGIVMCRATR